MANDELMRPVSGYDGRYSVTADGRVWAHPNASRSQGRWLRPTRDRFGYLYVCLFNGARKNVKVHRLVADEFCQLAGFSLGETGERGNLGGRVIQRIERSEYGGRR